MYFSSRGMKNWDQSSSSPQIPKIFVVTSLLKHIIQNSTTGDVIFVTSSPGMSLFLPIKTLAPSGVTLTQLLTKLHFFFF